MNTNGMLCGVMEPQDAGPDHHQRQRVWKETLSWPALALAQDERRNQGRDAGIDVNRGTTGEVE